MHGFQFTTGALLVLLLPFSSSFRFSFSVLHLLLNIATPFLLVMLLLHSVSQRCVVQLLTHVRCPTTPLDTAEWVTVSVLSFSLPYAFFGLLAFHLTLKKGNA